MSAAAALEANAKVITAEIEWFEAVLELRMRMHAGEPGLGEDPLEVLPPPEGLSDDAPYAAVVESLGLGPAERIVLILAFLPHVRPAALDPFFIVNRALDRRFTEFGGLIGMSHGGFLPTGETAMYLLAGDDVGARLRWRGVFQADHVLYRENVLRLDHRHDDEPLLSGALVVTPAYLERLATGGQYEPPFSASFPAKRLTTEYEWDDLVLDPETMAEVEDIVAWAKYRDVLMNEWGLARRLPPGYRVLFYGPPGTGKTLTAALLGKRTGLPVYRVDLSRVMSKWIGETEKNLASLFDHAEHGDWILFFDEADALFGKRTEASTANDRAANQQIAYLLHRLEEYPGIAILATNQRRLMDEAFDRRLQSTIKFALPDEPQRLRLWQRLYIEQSARLDVDIDFETLASEHEISGATIVNVLRYCWLRASARASNSVKAADIAIGIVRESQRANSGP